MSAEGKTIGLMFIDRFADWEYGLLSASAVEWFGAKAVAISPDGQPVRSASGFRLMPDRGMALDENRDLDAVAVIGSDGWAESGAPDPQPLLTQVAARGGVVGGICAGTLALARAGMFAGKKHTSNGADWIGGHLPHYEGSELYQDVPHAVADARVVSAPGSAPATFATGFLQALYPERAEAIAEMKRMFSSEHAS